MSLRNLRKVYGGTTLPAVNSDDDDDYEPLCATFAAPKYEGLVLSSDSNNEEAHNITDEEADSKPVNVKQTKKKKKKNKKNKAGASGLQNLKDGEELDEIDRSVMEVNALLGAPAPVPAPDPVQRLPLSPEVALLTVQLKHLNVENEVRRLFGPDEDDKNKKKQRNANTQRLAKKSVIVPIPESFLRITKIGLSMSILRREQDCTYFAFDHSREYQKHHQALLFTMHLTNEIALPEEQGLGASHVESILESADKLFKVEEYLTASKLLEQVIAFMQYVAHPSFALANRKTRLEYKVLENRPFHVAMLKYAYLVSNRACHRTALEVCKLLLNLEPTDPLAVLFCIDIFAIRAREHQWLLDAVDQWRVTRDAGYLFNLQYSYALAKYHVVTNNKQDIKEAEQALHKAILQFPTVVVEIIECASLTPSSRLMAHPLYTELGSDTTPRNLKRLIHLYAKLTWHKWKEPGVFDWFMSNALAIADTYDKDLTLQAKARDCSQQRMSLFRGWPTEISRHISVIRPMSQLIADGAVPLVNRTRSFDPLPPPGGINRYRYLDQEQQRDPSDVVSGTFLDFIASVLPAYQPREAVAEVAGERERGGEAAGPAPPMPPLPAQRQQPPPLNAGLQEHADDDAEDAHVMHRTREAAAAVVAEEIAMMSPNDVSTAVRRVRAYLDGFELGLRMGQFGDTLATTALDHANAAQADEAHDGRVAQLHHEAAELQQHASGDGTSDDQQQPPPE